MTEVKVIVAKTDGEVLEQFTIISAGAEDEARLSNAIRDTLEMRFEVAED